MQLFKLLVPLGIVVLGVNGLSTQKQFLITYPNETPQSELNGYKDAISAAGCEIIHEYTLIKGFVVKASEQAVETIHTLSQKYKPTIEDDQTVTIQDRW